MRSIRVFLVPFLTTVCLMLALRAAQAQISPFLRGEPQLTEGDLIVVEETTRMLLGRGRTGSTAAWQNAESGNSGTISLEEAFEARGAPCRRFGHIIRFKNEEDPQTLSIVLCRVGAEWKFAG